MSVDKITDGLCHLSHDAIRVFDGQHEMAVGTDDAIRAVREAVEAERGRQEELKDRLSRGREYLMGIHPDSITVDDTLEAFGYNKSGWDYTQ